MASVPATMVTLSLSPWVGSGGWWQAGWHQLVTSSCLLGCLTSLSLWMLLGNHNCKIKLSSVFSQVLSLNLPLGNCFLTVVFLGNSWVWMKCLCLSFFTSVHMMSWTICQPVHFFFYSFFFFLLITVQVGELKGDLVSFCHTHGQCEHNVILGLWFLLLNSAFLACSRPIKNSSI